MIAVMKKTTLATLILLAAGMLAFFACEPFDNPDNTDPRDNFTGNWTVNEVSALYGTNTYTVTIVYDPSNSSQVLIRNFYHFGFDIDTYAIPTTGTITVPEQFTCNHTIKGKGTLSKNKIEWTYTANDGADTDSVAATYTKQ